METKERTIIRVLLGQEESEERLQEAANQVKELAYQELIDWIGGEYRPVTLSELTVNRVANIFGSIIEEVPTLERIVDAFNLPVGKARYVVSVLNYKKHPGYQRILHEKAIDTLEGSIEGEEDTKEVIPFFRGPLIDIINRTSTALLYDQNAEGYDGITWLPGQRGVGLEGSINVASAKILIEELRRRLGQLES